MLCGPVNDTPLITDKIDWEQVEEGESVREGSFWLWLRRKDRSRGKNT